VTPDDLRLAKASRLLRRRAGLRQSDLVAPGRSIHFVHDLEAARIGKLAVEDVRAHFGQLGASLRVTAWWNGAQLDRLIDEVHSAVVESLVRELGRYAWPTLAEFTFSEYGERGSIDVFAGKPEASAAFVGEAKSDWGSLEETMRSLDIKTRLAPILCRKAFGFTPQHVAAALVFPESSTARRVAARRANTLSTAFPAGGREIRAWLRQPSGALRGLWFLSNVHLDGSVRRRRRP
jgi:hypothetical protein